MVDVYDVYYMCITIIQNPATKHGSVTLGLRCCVSCSNKIPEYDWWDIFDQFLLSTMYSLKLIETNGKGVQIIILFYDDHAFRHYVTCCRRNATDSAKNQNMNKKNLGGRRSLPLSIFRDTQTRSLNVNSMSA